VRRNGTGSAGSGRAHCAAASRPGRPRASAWPRETGEARLIIRAAPRLLERTVRLRPGETGAALWSFTYFFCLLCSYYVLRPVREEMGVAGGVERLPWLFTGTFLAMLVAVPIFGALAARYPRRTLLPVVYAFFIACILGLFALLRGGAAGAWAPPAFFIWLSVFNLFVVSVFWSFMADVWREEQARRLFGFIAAGGSAGAIAGPAFTAAVAARIGPINLLPIAALVLAAALVCIARLRQWAHAAAASPPDDERALGGGATAGITLVLRSSYLLAICVFVAFTTALATFVYFQQAQIVRAAFTDPAQRTALFALIDLAVNVLTIVTQVFVTGRLLTGAGLARALAVLPSLSVVGFAALAAAPVLPVLVAYQVLRRAATYGVNGPARETLFTVVMREEKYKAKNVIDTVINRGGDAVTGWAFAGLMALGLGVRGIALVAIPLCAAWIAVAIYLGRREEALREQATPDAAAVREVLQRA
jgi:AAA family ATP:ADP antiporter